MTDKIAVLENKLRGIDNQRLRVAKELEEARHEQLLTGMRFAWVLEAKGADRGRLIYFAGT